MSLTTRRRAIYTGLAGHFGEDEILPLLSLWEAKYADKPPFALNEFLGEVAQRSGRKLERARLYRELVGALTGPASNLLPDPAPRVHAWRQGEGLEAEEVSGPDALARQTFEALSQALFGLLDPDMVPRLRRFAAGNLNGMQLETELRLRLRGWLEQGGLARPDFAQPGTPAGAAQSALYRVVRVPGAGNRGSGTDPCGTEDRAAESAVATTEAFVRTSLLAAARQPCRVAVGSKAGCRKQKTRP